MENTNLSISPDNLLYIIGVLCGAIVALSAYIVRSFGKRIDKLEERCDNQHRSKPK
jgi:hypothetical protein